MPPETRRRQALVTSDLDKKVSAVLFILFSILYVSTVTQGEDGYNGASRLALVQALVEHGTFSIDRSLYLPLTEDKAYVRGHYYTDKAPGQPLLAAPLYWALYHLGISFSGHRRVAEIFLKVPFALLAALVPALFFIVSKSYSTELRGRLVVSLALGAGTGIVVLAGVFFSHASAAAFLLMSFYFTLRARQDTNWLWLSGAASGVAIFLEYPAALPAVAMHLTFLSRHRIAEAGKSILAAAPFIVCILVLNFHITGKVLDFPYYHTGDWPGSPLPVDSNRFEPRAFTFQRVAQMFLFGRTPQRGDHDYFQGLFLYSPFLLLGLFFSKREHVIILLGCLGVAVLYLGAVTDDAVGGCTFSNRYLLITLPFLALPALEFVRRWPRVFVVTAAVSIVVNFIGAITVPLSCARFTLGDAIAHLPELSHHLAALSAFAIILLMFFPVIAARGDAMFRERYVSEIWDRRWALILGAAFAIVGALRELHVLPNSLSLPRELWLFLALVSFAWSQVAAFHVARTQRRTSQGAP